MVGVFVDHFVPPCRAVPIARQHKRDLHISTSITLRIAAFVQKTMWLGDAKRVTGLILAHYDVKELVFVAFAL